MAFSGFLAEVLQRKQTPVLDSYWTKRQYDCLATSSTQSRIGMYAALTPQPKELDWNAMEKGASPTSVDNASSTPITYERLGPGVIISDITSTAEIQDHSQSHLGPTIIFISQRNTFARLDISLKLLEHLIKQYGIFDKFKGLLLCFGPEYGESNLAPPPILTSYNFGARSSLKQETFECVYIVRFIEENHRSQENPWSLRQSLIYQKWDSTSIKKCNLIFVRMSDHFKDRLGEYLDYVRDPTAVNLFEVNLLFLDTAIATWRPYIAYLSAEIESQNVLARMVDLKEGAGQALDLPNSQYLVYLEDRLGQLTAMLQHTASSLTTITDHYKRSLRHQAHGRQCNSDQDITFDDQFLQTSAQMMQDLDHSCKQAELLRCKVRATSDMVSTILDLGSSDALKRLTEKASEESASVNVLSIIGLIYLPTSVVSNFFSMAFSDHNSNHIRVFGDVWIFFVSCIVLTVLTLAVWLGTIWTRQKAEKKRQFGNV